MSDETAGSGRHARPGDDPDRTVDTGAGDGRSAVDDETGAEAPTRRVAGASHRAPDGSAVPDDPPTVDHDTPAGSPDATPTVGTGTGAADDRDAATEAGTAVGSSRGRVRYQDPETTTPREPTVAEQRARREAEKRRQAQDAAAVAAEERRRKNRKRALIGGGVAVGLVAIVAISYAASSGDDEVSAQCTDRNTGAVVPDENCGTQQGGYTDANGTFVPLFIPLGGFGGNQYRYNYGTNAPVGTVPRGGSVTPPANGTSLRSGTTGGNLGSATGSGSVSRGGLGVGGSSGSSSGS